MLFIRLFFSNLFCSFFSCEYHRPDPVSLNADYDVEMFDSFGVPPAPLVRTRSGLVEGYFMNIFNCKIYAFEGIPYAENPENMRFKDAMPVMAWNGIRSAKSPSAECLQFNLPMRVSGKEDCLELNIYTPLIATGEYNPKLPVLLFIHGGSFIHGRASDLGPTYLLQENIILVTINYRLGVLGFLSTGDEEAPGNYGLKDQALAIKWVYENIEGFGGDNTRITLAGPSSGAASAHLHMLSSSNSKYLFRNAISISGSASLQWALQTPNHARKLTEDFASRLFCPIDQGSKAMMDCLRKIEPNFLVASQNNLIKFLTFPGILFAPVIEPNMTSAFITESVESAYENGNVAEIPFLCTNTAEESEYMMMIFKNVGMLGHIFRNWEMRGPLLLDVEDYVDNPREAVVEIRDVYLKDVEPSLRAAVTDSNMKLYAKMFSDRYFFIGNRRSLKLHGEIAPTYSYIFKYKSNIGVASLMAYDYKDWGSSHSEDMILLFNSSALVMPIKMDDENYKVSRNLVSIIANFVIHNVPYSTSVNGTLLEIWKPIGDLDNPMFLEISSEGEMKMIPDPLQNTEEFKVWNRLGIR